MKFQVGDKVVVLINPYRFDSFNGDGAYVSEVCKLGCDVIFPKHPEYKDGLYFLNYEIADAELYNSPLYRALL